MDRNTGRSGTQMLQILESYDEGNDGRSLKNLHGTLRRRRSAPWADEREELAIKKPISEKNLG